MNIRFVIFLITIFMVFVPCYGMQVAINHETLLITSKVTAKVYKILKAKNDYVILSVLYFVIGLVFLINAILKKKNKNKIWGTILIFLGIFVLTHGAFLSFMWLILAILSPLQATGLLFGVALFLTLVSLTSVFFGYKLVRKGRKEEKEKKERKITKL